MAVPAEPIDDRKMTLGEHLNELRWHVLRAVIYVAVALTAALFFQGPLMDVVTRPFTRVVRELKHDAITRISADVPPATRDAAGGWIEGRDRIHERLRDIDRQASAVKEELEKDPEGRAKQFAKDQAELEDKLAKLDAELRALAAKPDELKARELDARRKDLAAQVAELEARGAPLAALVDEGVGFPDEKLRQGGPVEGFLAYLKISLIAALCLASPFVARELWKFVGKGLYSHEKRYVVIFAPLTYVAFFIGAAFGYFYLIPFGLKYLATYSGPEFRVQFDMTDYISLFVNFCLAVGLTFELPLVMAFVSLLGLVSPETYAGFRRYWILVAFILAVFLAPAPEPVSQTMCAVPLIVLFEMGIWLSRFVTRHRKEQSDQEPPPPSSPSPPPSIAATPPPLALPMASPPPSPPVEVSKEV